MKTPQGLEPARPSVQPCEDATRKVVRVTAGTPWEVRAARTRQGR